MSENEIENLPPYSPWITLLRLVTFRASRDEMAAFDKRHLLLGLLLVWLVGMGRTWDDPQVELLRRLGLGSLVYVFCLTFLLWMTFKPLVPQATYRHVLTFICLAALPGAIYAMPVERWFDPNTARNINAWFLLIVATWRVALLVFYLYRFGQLEPYESVICTLLPLVIIMAPLTIFQVLNEIMQGMAMMRQGPPPAPAQQITQMLGLLSLLAFFPLLFSYQSLVGQAKQRSTRG